jgi:1,4-alpha-glucan branching enzyme
MEPDRSVNHKVKSNITVYLTGFAFLVIASLVFVFQGIHPFENDIAAVVFSLNAPEAKSVSLVGDFNNWNLMSMPMEKRNGIWEIKAQLKKDRVYTYNFVIDRQNWITDPNSIESIEDGFGGESSVLKI